MSAALIAEARARLAAAFPGSLDATGDPHPKPSAPAFAVSLAYSGGERLAMGDGRHFRDGDLIVAIWAKPGLALAEQTLHDQAATATAAIMAAPADLAGTAWSVEPVSADPDHDAGEERISRAEVTFAIRVIEPAA